MRMNTPKFKWTDKSNRADISVTLLEKTPTQEYYRISVDYPEKCFPEEIILSWEEDLDSGYILWAPNRGVQREMHLTWCPGGSDSRSANGAPVCSHFSKTGKNIVTFALNDATTPAHLAIGVDEARSKIRCYVYLFTFRVDMTDHYETVLRIDRSDDTFYDTIYNVRLWWKSLGYTAAPVPEFAKRAMLSSWYTFHQDVSDTEVLEQCRLGKEFGLDTVILDDGWQGVGGYASCGDWKPMQEKFPDMRGFVDKLHEMGMKIILWYSVPFIGLNASNLERFQGRYLNNGDPHLSSMILDPRFADQRAFLVETYENAVREWDLDGLKLDFIDSFILSPNSSTDYDAMDIPTLELAIVQLLEDIMVALKALKPDIMIEFRQSYIGPVMQKYGNLLRVADCGGSSLSNRVHSIDLRLLTGDPTAMNVSAIHSDMLMWDYDAAPEAAADQLAACLFCVPQISVRPDRLTPEHRKVLKQYLDFVAEYRPLLLEEKLIPLHPEANYSQAYVKRDNMVVAALYENPLFVLPEGTEKLALVNATAEELVCLSGTAPIDSVHCVIKNCMGDILRDETISLAAGVTAFDVPYNGFLILD